MSGLIMWRHCLSLVVDDLMFIILIIIVGLLCIMFLFLLTIIYKI